MFPTREATSPDTTTGAGSARFASRDPLGNDGRSDVETDYRWIVRVWCIVAAVAVVTAWKSAQIDIPLRDPSGAWFVHRAVYTIVAFIVLSLLDAVWRAPRGSWGPRGIVRTYRGRWPARRLALAAVGLLAYHLVYICYRNLKSWDAFNTVQDDLLDRVDRWLFFGHSPAVLLHDLLGQHVAAWVLAVLYESFSTVVSISFVAAMVFANRLRDGYVFLTSLIWVWILGVSTYYLIPSIGPFHSAAQDFAGLPHTMITDTQARYMEQRANLLANPSGDAYAQISAFASLHVGVTCVIVLMLYYFGYRVAGHIMTVYLAGTILATVYLGWHFVVDDIAGLLIAAAAVALGRLTIYPKGRRPRSALDESAVPDRS